LGLYEKKWLETAVFRGENGRFARRRARRNRAFCRMTYLCHKFAMKKDRI